MARQKCEIGVKHYSNDTWYGYLAAFPSGNNTREIYIDYSTRVYKTRPEAVQKVNDLARFLGLVGRAK